MKSHRLYCNLAACLVAASCLLLLTGCQALFAGSGGTSAVSLSNSNLSFGTVAVGGSVTLTDTLSNTTSSPVTIGSISGTSSIFQVTGVSLPLVLAAGQNVTFSVQFQPSAVGSLSATIPFVSNSGQTYASLSVAGNSVTAGKLGMSPSTLNFGNVKVGSSQTTIVNLSNSGGTDLTISKATLSGAGFTANNLPLPLTLQAGNSASISVTFAPPSSGVYNGSISFTTTAAEQGDIRRVHLLAQDSGPATVALQLEGDGVASGTLAANPSSLSFGNVQDGTSSTLSETVTNTGGTSVNISQATVTGSGFSVSGFTVPATLTPGQSVSFNVIFNPTTAGSASGNISIVSDASNSPLGIPLSGTGVTEGDLSPSPASIAFGNIAIGSSGNQTETLTNNGGTSVTISAASATGTGFSISGISVPLTLNAGQSTSFTVKFAPTGTGAASGNVAITSNGSNPNLSIPLSGTGITEGDLTPNPASMAFGNIQIGTSSTQTETLTNNGGTAVTISAASASGTGFSLNGISLPITLNSGQSTSFTVKFAPTAAGTVSGSIAVTSNGSNPNLSIALSGTGVTQGTVSPNPSSISFGSVQVGTSSNQTETLTNSGGSSLTISAASAGGTGFSISGISVPLTLNAGQSTSFTVTFNPASAGSASGSVSITSNGSNPNLSIPLSGTGVTPGTLSANPSSLAFGSIQVGTSTNLSETLTNTGGSSVTITQANLSGSAFSISGLTLPVTLTPTQSVTFKATFSPTSSGAASGTLSIVSNASNSPLSIALSGTGTAPGQLSVSPTTLSFGSVTVGSSTPLTGTLSATGGAVTVSSAGITNSEFTLSGLTLPQTLTAGQSVPYTVTFTPSASGSASGTLTFTSNASNSPTTQSLTGTGTTPASHYVDLNWDASTGAVSYNVYRKLPTDTSYTQIDSGDGTTAYTDNNVTAGTTYNYVVTAVNGEDQESGYSNMATVTVPSP